MYGIFVINNSEYAFKNELGAATFSWATSMWRHGLDNIITAILK